MRGPALAAPDFKSLTRSAGLAFSSGSMTPTMEMWRSTLSRVSLSCAALSWPGSAPGKAPSPIAPKAFAIIVKSSNVSSPRRARASMSETAPSMPMDRGAPAPAPAAGAGASPDKSIPAATAMPFTPSTSVPSILAASDSITTGRERVEQIGG